MKRILFFASLLLACSCSDKYQWVEDLKMEIQAYDRNAQLVEEPYSVDSGTSTSIFIAPYGEKNGLRKIVFSHMRVGVMYFERHIYLKQDNVVFEHHMGIAPRLVKQQSGGVKTSDYLVFNKQSFFKDSAIGKRFRQQQLINEYKPKDSVLSILKSLNVEESHLYEEDYLEIKNYLKDVTTLDRVE